MARALDHLVVATRDLGRSAEQFADLGFQVGARNRHPWGTENHIIQFRSSFLELIAFAAGFRPLEVDDPAFFFTTCLQRYLARQESGIAMAVLRTADAHGDAERFKASGWSEGRVLPFSRAARRPDGSDSTVAFTVAFAAAPTMPEIGFFTCEQHRPENFWNPAFQVHGNGGAELTGLTIAAADPQAQAAFLAGFADSDAATTAAGSVSVPLAGGAIEVETAAASDEARIGFVRLRMGARAERSARLAVPNAGPVLLDP